MVSNYSIDIVFINRLNLPKWGITGDITGYNERYKAIKVSEPLVFEENVEQYITILTAQGSPSAEIPVEKGPDEYSFIPKTGYDNISYEPAKRNRSY